MADILEKRIEQCIRRIAEQKYRETEPLTAEVTVDTSPIPHGDLKDRKFRAIMTGEQWGELWESSWFRFSGKVPVSWKGKCIAALIDIGGEGCLFEDGVPRAGITYKKVGDLFERKRRIMLSPSAEGGEKVELLIEGAANGLFGGDELNRNGSPWFHLNQAELAVFDAEAWQLSLDMDFLLNLKRSLDPESPRCRSIARDLEKIANLSPPEEHIAEAREIAGALIRLPAQGDAQTAWSVGHAHLDLAWLWPYRETRRKAGRTFSTALRLIEEYPEYIFGASQPQMFAWVKEDYPELYNEIKEQIKSGRIECQGGMWVEPDMNIPTGESLVRQCLYGKRFFKEEFGKDLKNLWLPDVFGYSAALPQILKKAGIDHFVTQKISWNETNTFPHHTFVWTGIDGTSIDSHFLPTDTYNCSNDPEIMIASEKRYKQNDVRGGFLNLYGVGDGGGGPSRRHIEMMKRGENCQGMPRMKAARAEEFLDYLDGEDSGDLPVWQGELYLELHRGTYTTQSLMKKRNRLSEQALRDTELLQTMAMTETGSEYPRQQIEKSWKATLCNQFHDVLPGSSIAEVYEDAHRISAEVLKDLKELEDSAIATLFPEEAADQITLINTQSHSRREWIEIDGRDHQIDVPALGAVSLSLNDLKNLEEPKEKRVTWDSTSGILENEVIRIELEEDGTIGSLYMKEMAREMLKGGANRFLLYEDRPYSWDAWDVSAYYRDTVPEQAVLAGRKLVKDSKASVIIEQDFTVGKSRIIQILELRSGESLVRSECRVQWLEDEKMLRLNALPAINWPRASYEIQFGVIERPAHSNTSWDQAQFEVCGHRFADYSQTDRGLALINDCKYGYRIQDGVMELNLLRSPLYPDSGADRGDHSFAFAYMPHAGGLQSSSVQEEAFAFNSPLKMIRGRTASGTGGQSWFSMDHSAIRIESIKAAEEGSGIILRLYETKGGDARGTLSSFRPVRMAEETSLLEEKTGDLDCPDGKVMLDFHPFEIKTVRLYLS